MSDSEMLHGWLEMLYRKDGDPPERMADINADDYMAIGSRLPLVEFDNMFDVVAFYTHERADVLRTVQPFDIINLFKTSPVVGSNTFLLVPPDKFKRFIRKDCEHYASEWTDMRLIPVYENQRFQSLINE